MMNMALTCGYCFNTVGTALVYIPEDMLKIKDFVCRDCEKRGVMMKHYDEGLDALK